MEETDLRKISNGDTGAKAASIIYENDTNLFNKAQICLEQIEANRKIIDNVSGGSIQFVAESTTGESISNGMTQQAATKALIEESGVTSGVCCIQDEIFKLNISGDDYETASIAEFAKYDENGASIEVAFDEILEYKQANEAILNSMLSRVSNAENEVTRRYKEAIDNMPKDAEWVSDDFLDEWDKGSYDGPAITPKPREYMNPFKRFIKETTRLAQIANKVINGEI